MGQQAYTHVFWDWNGTLLDDVDWCRRCINTMLARRDLPTLDSTAAYREVFGFPIIDYYRRAGFRFDTEPFEVLAEEYIALYHGGDKAHCALFPGAADVLGAIRGAGLRQIVLSASKTSYLHQQMEGSGIAGFFDAILGISDIYGASKVAVGQAYFSEQGIADAVFVGDTLHDHDVAQALGADCVLVASGHHSKERLAATGARVVEDIAQVPALLGL